MNGSTLPDPDSAARLSFAELARNVRSNLDHARSQPSYQLEQQLLRQLVDVLEQKIGGRRPELPESPLRPYDSEYDRLPRPNPTKSQLRSKKQLEREIRSTQRQAITTDEQKRKAGATTSHRTPAEVTRFNV